MVPYRLLLLLTDDEPQKHAPMRFTPGGCCPCGEPQCTFCTLITSEWEVVIADVENSGTCFFCTAVTRNGTYRVRYAPNLNFSCRWQYVVVASQDVELLVHAVGSDLKISVTVRLAAFNQFTFSKVIQAGSTAPFDCSAVTPDTDLPDKVQVGTEANLTSATCRVTPKQA